VKVVCVLIETPEGPASSLVMWAKWSGLPGGSCICLECALNVAYSCSVVVYAWCVIGSWFGLVLDSHVVLASGAACICGWMERQALPSRLMVMSCSACVVRSFACMCMIVRVTCLSCLRMCLIMVMYVVSVIVRFHWW